jgi:AI-2 transport protein TqsA
MATDTTSSAADPSGESSQRGVRPHRVDSITARRYPRGTIILVGIAAATVAIAGISGIRGILAPVLLTLVLIICAYPIRTALLKIGTPGGPATVAVMLTVFALLAAFAFTVFIALAQFVEMLPSYSKQFQKIASNIGAWLASIGIGQAQVEAVEKSIKPSNIAAAATGILGSVGNITVALVIIFTMVILMAADSVYIPTIMRQLGTQNRDLVTAISQYTSNVRRYMVVTTALGVVQGVLNALFLYIVHVPAALLWGLLAFLCSFIPNIGYFFAIVPPIVFGFLVGGWPLVIAIIVVYGIINAVVQSIIQPRVVGHAVSLSQTITFFSVLFWAVIIGPIGAVLAIPLTLLGKTFLLDANPEVHWWRPALGPTSETRDQLKDETASAKQERRGRRADKKAAKDVSG